MLRREKAARYKCLLHRRMRRNRSIFGLMGRSIVRRIKTSKFNSSDYSNYVLLVHHLTAKVLEVSVPNSSGVGYSSLLAKQGFRRCYGSITVTRIQLW